MTRFSVCATATLCVLIATPLLAQGHRVAPNAPKDQPLTASTGSEAMRMFFAMEPYIAHARASWPEAKRRFLAGLPHQHTFFVTTRLRDANGRIEQIYVGVDSIVAKRIYGRVWSQIVVVEGYRLHQPYDFPEDDLLDWMIARPDGTEEGNVVGRFLDTFRP